MEKKKDVTLLGRRLEKLNAVQFAAREIANGDRHRKYYSNIVKAYDLVASQISELLKEISEVPALYRQKSDKTNWPLCARVIVDKISYLIKSMNNETLAIRETNGKSYSCGNSQSDNFGCCMAMSCVSLDGPVFNREAIHRALTYPSSADKEDKKMLSIVVTLLEGYIQVLKRQQALVQQVIDNDTQLRKHFKTYTIQVDLSLDPLEDTSVK